MIKPFFLSLFKLYIIKLTMFDFCYFYWLFRYWNWIWAILYRLYCKIYCSFLSVTVNYSALVLFYNIVWLGWERTFWEDRCCTLPIIIRYLENQTFIWQSALVLIKFDWTLRQKAFLDLILVEIDIILSDFQSILNFSPLFIWAINTNN